MYNFNNTKAKRKLVAVVAILLVIGMVFPTIMGVLM